MNKYRKLLFRKPVENLVLIRLRERLLKVMLISSAMLGTVLYAFALIPVLYKSLYSTILFYAFLYLWILLITFLPKLPYRVRASLWLGLLFVLGSMNLFMSGFNVDAGLFLITFIAMAVLLMDLQGGVAALVLGSIAVSLLGFINVSENFKLSMGLPQSDPLLWIIGGIIFLLIGMLLIYSLTIVVHGLENNLTKTTMLAGELELTNQSLRMSEARYRTLMETSPGLVTLCDLEGNILMANQVGLELFGYKQLEEVIGKNMRVFIAPEDQEIVTEAFRRTLEFGEQKDIEFQAIKINGYNFFAEFSSKVVVDEAGKPLAVIGVGKDITERKKAERLLQDAKDMLAEKVMETSAQLEQTTGRLEELIKNAPTVVYSFLPADSTITYMSENIRELLGYEPAAFTEDINFWRDHVHPDDRQRVIDELARPESRESCVYECRFLKNDGAYRWLRGERKLHKSLDGVPLEYVGTLSDINESKIAEETLKISEAKYRNLYDGMMDAYNSVDMEGRLQQFNHAFESMLGYTTNELNQLTYKDITPRKWHDFEAEIIEKQVLRRGYSDIYEKEYIRKDGSVLPVELRTKLIKDKAGNPVGMWAIIRDVSERKLIEQVLRESESRYRELLDNSMQGVLVFQDMRVVYTNQAVSESLGYSTTELETRTSDEIIALVHPDDQSMFQDKLRSHLDDVPSAERYSLRVRHKNGEIRWIDARTEPIDLQGKPALMTTAIDVTSIKQAEALLKESEKVLRTILNAPEAVVFLIDRNGELISANDKFIERWGKGADSLIGKNIYDILPPEISNVRKTYVDKVIDSGNPCIFHDKREGSWFEHSLYPIPDESGQIARVAIFTRDITEQRRMSEALRASEEQYRQLAEAAHDMIFIINRQDCIQYVNSFGASFLGLPAQDLVGQPRGRYFPDNTNEHQQGEIFRVFETGEAISSETANEFPNGTIWLNTWLVPLKDAGGTVTGVLGVSRDISDRKQSEFALERARDELEEKVSERTRALWESQEKLRIITAQTITSQEGERRAIARELHDEAGQALIILKYGLAAIQNELPEAEIERRQRLSESMAIIDQTMTHIRGLAHSLRPPVLDVGGIDLSLQDLCQELSRRTKIPIYYQGEEILGLTDEVGISLYRFVQEALTNILKHAQASEVKVKLKQRKKEIILSVSDNGRGMDDNFQSGGLGLLGITERLNLLGGKLIIVSHKGRGSTLVARVPWEQVTNQ